MSTYEPIASQTLGSAAATVTFSSIPQGYTDLILVVNNAQASGSNSLRFRFNNDSGSNYSDTYLGGNGTTAVSGRDTSQTSGVSYAGSSTTINTNYIVQFMNYSNSTTYKTCLSRSNGTAELGADVNLWRNTSAITSITLAMGSTFPASNFASGSTFSLYGIQVGTVAQKAQGGNIVTSDGTYVYHTFTSSGAFIPSQALTVDYLVVAGGGGGGGNINGGNGGGGGGGGGVRSTVTATGGGGSLESALSLTAKSYPVIVGAGGAGGPANSSCIGTSGSNSIFSTITSTGGGGGGGSNTGQNTGLTGGSGGGSSPYITAPNGAAGTANQGYAGGNPINGGSYGAGGGGGAGAVGANASSSAGGNGGNGVAVSILGTSVTYAGGGGGGVYGNYTSGTGGSGGGGNAGAGSASTYGNSGSSGTVNLGGGGGGSSNFNTATAGGNGGSGIVIIRYAI